MDFFGITVYGPQNYIKDVMKEDYQEPMSKKDADIILQRVKDNSTLPGVIQRPDVEMIRIIDCYIGRVNGFAYGSMQRFIKMKRKGVIKAAGPCDMFRFPPTTSVEFGWWQNDPVLARATWYQTWPKYPQPASPNTLILEKVRKNNKYASLF